MREDSGIAPSLMSLPSGGGGVSPLGDRFEPDLVRGSGSYSVPLQCPFAGWTTMSNGLLINARKSSS